MMTIAMLVCGCSSTSTDEPQENPPEEPPVVEPDVPQNVPFTSAAITPSVLKVKVNEELQASAKTYPENATESGVLWVSDNENIASIDENGLIKGHNPGTVRISVRGAETNKTLSSKILNVIDIPYEEKLAQIEGVNTGERADIKYSYHELVKASSYDNMDYCPTIGNPQLLVIPIWFSDSDSFIDIEYRDYVREDIEKAYFGDDYETGWESVKSYYYKESSGLCTLGGIVTDWYEVGQSYKNYGRSTESTVSLVTQAVNWFFAQENNTLTRKDFDSDKNGYIDGVMLIYGAPDYSSLGNGGYSNLWAYTYWMFKPSNNRAPVPNAFFWASYDFMYGQGSDAQAHTGKSSYGNGETEHCTIDTHTFIHEMGHVFGLDDYYDYSSQYSPAGGFSMQDYNMGGHDPFSVMAYGWADPYIVSDDMEIVIGEYQKTREFILLTPQWNLYGSPFDEYILLELYSPTGLNEFDSVHRYGYYPQGPSDVKVRMWHVDARLLAFISAQKYYLTTDVNATSVYGVQTAFNNTYYRNGSDNNRITYLGKSYADHNLLQLIRNDVSETYRPRSMLSNENMFGTGTYNLKDYANQFVYGSKGEFNNGESLDWTIDITIGLSGSDFAAKINITKNDNQ